MPDDLLREYQQLQSGGPVDLIGFLSSRPQTSTEARLKVILHDLQERWTSSQPWKVEDYLERFPEYASDPDAIVALVKTERKAQFGIETTPALSEIAERFPQLASHLPEQMRSIDSKSFESSDPFRTVSRDPNSSSVSILASRYRTLRLIGQGAFGRVYLAVDLELERQVAIKVPLPERFQGCDDANTYLAEARTVASLTHPHIVPVYDMGRTPEGAVFVVSRFIEGTTLEEKLKSNSLQVTDLVSLLKTVAEALHYAHGQRLIHRDVKPANILIEESTRTPFVADFGLAIREEDYAKLGGLTGTPTYMSPEQARGEGHRLDGRSDVFSLGVILYGALTGQRPFRGSTLNELLHQIVSVEPRAPRNLREDTPAELERICLKALNKRVSDRYTSAAALAEDLAAWLQPKSTQSIQSQREEQIVPKGLRSFDASDASYFLDLLPGIRNREGLPESIAFWKQRIEQTDPELTFNVGLIYGPSGCGKSSLVKAGLIPHLDKDIVAVYVEATSEDTEVRVLRGLRKRLPELSVELGLADTLAALRRAKGRKIVIIIDQFEQWLHEHRPETDAELVAALRQCDGGRLQAIVMIRDDFAMAAVRFMNVLDVPIVQGVNFATVDLFDVDHAAKVIIRFGQAFGKLPASIGNLSLEEQRFVSEVSLGLARDGKIVSVRLSLFAEMVKGKPWTPTTLQQFGGTDGIGVSFLEETFSSPQANPRHRLHSIASRSVLSALLPELGMDIKGHMRSQAELLEVSGYKDRPSDFSDLLRILDGELRLITPTDPERNDYQSKSDLSRQYYQLTHDYLVPSLRDWLTRKQRETRKGRAELQLAECVARWSEKRENRQLPTLSEWFSIRTLTDSKKWTESEQTIMQRAGRVHGSWWGGLVFATCILSFGIQQWISSERWQNLQYQTRTSVEALQNNLGPSVPFNLEKLKTLPKELALPELQSRYASATNPRHKLSLAFALAAYGQLDADFLVSRVDDIAENDTGNYITAMQSNVPAALGAIKVESTKCGDKSLWRRKARLAITALSLGDILLPTDVCEIENRPDPEKRTFFIDEFPRWDNRLKEIHDLVATSDSAALRSGICIALGQMVNDKVSDDEKERWQSLASRWFVEKADTTTHSAAGWLLRRWGIAEPKLPDNDNIVSRRDWIVNSVGATLLKIPSNASASGGVKEFWVADREVTRGQFELFLSDKSYSDLEKPEKWSGATGNASPDELFMIAASYPEKERSEAFKKEANPRFDERAQPADWYDSIMYCNWLSLREGRKPCYERTGTKEKGQGKREYDAWRLIPGSNGYRLPSAAEWEYATRAGTQTNYSMGNDETLLINYCQMYPSKRETTSGEKIPNGWGLHDVHGSLWEWCEDSNDVRRVLRGGSYGNIPPECRSTSMNVTVPSSRNLNYGFRIAISERPVIRPSASVLK